MVRINATNIKKEMAIYLACVQEWSDTILLSIPAIIRHFFSQIDKEPTVSTFLLFCQNKRYKSFIFIVLPIYKM